MTKRGSLWLLSTLVGLGYRSPNDFEYLHAPPPRRHDQPTATVRETGSGPLAAVRDRRCGAPSQRDALKVLVDELDERAWDVQDEVTAGRAPQEAYIVAFSLARAASAVWFALDSDELHAALEAVNEAQAARGDLAGVRRRVQSLLT